MLGGKRHAHARLPVEIVELRILVPRHDGAEDIEDRTAQEGVGAGNARGDIGEGLLSDLGEGVAGEWHWSAVPITARKSERGPGWGDQGNL